MEIAGIFWFWTRRKSWGRHALLGLGFFLIFLAPFLGFIEISYMKGSWVEDHFLYLPMIGLIGLVVGMLGQVGDRLPRSVRPIGIGAVAFIFGLLAFESHAYARIFVRPTLFYAYIVARHPDSWADRNSMANALRQEGRIPEAIEQFREASALDPDASAPLNNLGAILMQSGHYPEALAAYENAVRIDPAYAEAHSGLGATLLRAGQIPPAIAQYEQALKLEPDSAQAHNGLSNALIASGRLSEAMAHSEEALKLAPNYIEGHCTMGSILARQGDIPGAIAQFECALELDPGNARIEAALESLRRPPNASPEKMQEP
jgi:tetratricopeptide (TPR) repeat protein